MVNQKRKYSLSAIFLIILLLIRFFGQIYAMFLSIEIESILLLATAVISAILYLIAVIGILMKTRWGLIFTAIIVMIDIILGSIICFIFDVTNIGSLIVDLIILVLVGRIMKRVKK